MGVEKIPMKIMTPPGRVVGAAPIFRHMADVIGLVEILNRLLSWDVNQCAMSPGERLLVLILDVRTGRSPLYRVADRWTTTDVAVVIGAGRRADNFSDDSLGRALDKLARAHPAKVFSTVATQAYLKEQITPWKWGIGTVPRGRSLVIMTIRTPYRSILPMGIRRTTVPISNRFYSRFSLIRMASLFSRSGTIESGQRSDKTLNGEMIDRLIEAVSPEQLAQLIYVADSALVTGPT